MIEINEEMLSAYVDGEATAEDSAAIEAAIARDPSLREKVTRYEALNRAIEASFAGAIKAPVPARLLAAASPRAAAGTPGVRRWLTPTAMAASLAVGFVVGTLTLPVPYANNDALDASARVAAALDQLGDGETREAIRVIASYWTAEARACRTFSVYDDGETSRGLACLGADDAWSLAALEPTAPAGAYLPAGEEASAVDALAAAMREMTPEEERALIARLTKRR